MEITLRGRKVARKSKSQETITETEFFLWLNTAILKARAHHREQNKFNPKVYKNKQTLKEWEESILLNAKMYMYTGMRDRA